MDESVLKHVGQRIRLYRKSRHMSTEQLARMINKSKATVSKYESGQITVDVVTLFDIAQALEIAPYQLMDYPVPGKKPSAPAKSPFGSCDQLYLYYLFRHNVYSSVLKLGPMDENGSPAATLFYDVDDSRNPEECSCIYTGRMFMHETVFSVVLNNYHNPVETALLNFTIPMRKSPILVGMLSGLGSSTFLPCARKVLIAREPLTVDEGLLEQMSIRSDTFREMKRDNMLYINLD